MSFKVKKNTRKWVEYEKDPEIKFLIKPFSVLYLSKLPSDENLTPELFWETFNQCVCDWSGIVDEEGKPLPCTTENKKLLAEQDIDILMWVALDVSRRSKEKEEVLKN